MMSDNLKTYMTFAAFDIGVTNFGISISNILFPSTNFSQTKMLSIWIIFFFLFYSLLFIPTLKKWWRGWGTLFHSFCYGIFIAGTMFLIFRYLIINKNSPPALWLNPAVGAILISIIFAFSLFWGQKVGKIEKDINFLRSSLEVSFLGSHALKLDKRHPFLIVFTHRPERGKSCLEDNLSPSIPRDEEEMISLICHWALSCNTKFEKKCSCESINEKLKKNSSIIILGDITNKYSKNIQNEIPNNSLRYYMIECPKELDDYLKSEKTPKYVFEDKVINKTDIKEKYIYSSENILQGGPEVYGLVTVLPNPYNVEYDLIILAGSRRNGQRTITEWFKNPFNLHKIIDCYNKGNKYIQFIIKGKIDNNKIEDIGILEDDDGLYNLSNIKKDIIYNLSNTKKNIKDSNSC